MPYSCTRLSSRPPFLLRHNGCRPSLSYTNTCRCRTACFNILKEKQIKLELCHSSVTVPYRNCSSAAATIIPLRHPLQLPFPLYRFMMYIHHKGTVSGRPVFALLRSAAPVCRLKRGISVDVAHCRIPPRLPVRTLKIPYPCHILLPLGVHFKHRNNLYHLYHFIMPTQVR